jgi:hypothetical protein
MALTDIIFYDIVAEANRGNIGVVSDTTIDTHTLFLISPITGDVRVNISYGPQGSFIGTLSPSGGGSSGYSRGRIVNA